MKSNQPSHRHQGLIWSKPIKGLDNTLLDHNPSTATPICGLVPIRSPRSPYHPSLSTILSVENEEWMVINAVVYLYAKSRNRRLRRRERDKRYLERKGFLQPKIRFSRLSTRQESDFKFFAQTNPSDNEWFKYVSLSRKSFKELVAKAQPLWESLPIKSWTHGHHCTPPRPQDLERRQLDCEETIGLTLYFFNSKDDLSQSIVRLFGILETSTSEYLKFGIDILLHILRHDPRSQFLWNTQDREYLNQMVEKAAGFVPELVKKYGRRPVAVFDGVCLRIQNKYADPQAHKNDYNDWKSRAQRKLILMFDFHGDIKRAVFNSPGRDHDSEIAFYGGIYDDINTLPAGYCVIADQGFKGGLQRNSKIIRVLKGNEKHPSGLTTIEVSDSLCLLTKMRQPTEWGNNSVKAHFKRLDNKLSANDEHNRNILETVLRLYNWRNATCDRQQLKTFFESLLDNTTP